MDFYDLDLDEAIIIQSSNVSRNGYDESEFEDEYLQEILLTNKNIVYVVAEDDGTDGEDCDVITVPLSAVKVINGQVQVKQYQHDSYGLCMQIQFMHGVEYWKFGNKAKQQIPCWVKEISDATLAYPRTVNQPQQNRSPKAEEYVESTCLTSFSDDTYVCANCGSKMLRTAKFCSACGAKASQTASHANEQESVVYDGKLHKCRNCGEILKAFETVCPVCGYELRDTYASTSIREFAEKMEKLQLEGKYKDKNNIITLIRTFPIPNTKEDLFEFIILSGSNIRKDRYTEGTPKYKQEISDAWEAKFEQAYQKAKLAFKEDQQFAEIKELYDKISREQKEAKKAEKRTFLWIIGGIPFSFLILIAIVAGSLSYDNSKIEKENTRLNAIVEEVYDCIDNKQYALARSKVATLVFSGSTTEDGEQAAAKWDTTRSQLLDMIDKAEYGDDYISPPRTIKIGASHESLKGKNYQDVKKQLEGCGFTNIRMVAIEDLITGWITSEGSVEKVSVGDDVVFSKDTGFLSNVEIVIYYHAMKNWSNNSSEETGNTPNNTSTATPSPSTEPTTIAPTASPNSDWRKVNVKNFTFYLPPYWAEEGSKNERLQYYAEKGDTTTMLSISYPQETDDAYDVSFEGLYADNENMIATISSMFTDGDVVSYEIINNPHGIRGILYTFTFTQKVNWLKKVDGTGYYFCFPSEDDRRWFMVVLTQTSKVAGNRYKDDYMEMIQNIHAKT